MADNKISADDDYGNNPDMSTDVEDDGGSMDSETTIVLPPDIEDEDVTH